MSADLTCETCKGSGMAPLYSEDGPTVQHFRCLPCNGTGRRPPTLPEWGALVAERDRLIDPDDMEAVAKAAEKWGPPPEGVQWRVLLAERGRMRHALEQLAWVSGAKDHPAKPGGECGFCGLDPCPYGIARHLLHDDDEDDLEWMDEAQAARAALDREDARDH